MTLTEDQRRLVVESFAPLVPIADQASTYFYHRLWEIAPETRSMFGSTDMAAQGMKLMQSLGVAVRAVHDLDSLTPYLRDLGQRHIGYGVAQEQYPLVGTALLWSIERCLGDDYTPELHDAWSATYALIISIALSAYE